MTIAEYLDSLKLRLLTDPIVFDFQIIRERATLNDGHLRARLTLTDASQLEFSEYVQRAPDDQISVVTYSYHWTDAAQRLIMRWDNTPHYPALANAPHHLHSGDEETVQPGQPMSLFTVLDEITARLSRP